MTRPLNRSVLHRSVVPSREEHMPHKLTRRELMSRLVQFLLAEILVLILWAGLRFLGIQPIGRPPIAGLVWTLVLVAGLAIFGLRQNLKGERGIGWAGALVTAVAATTASYVASALAGD